MDTIIAAIIIATAIIAYAVLLWHCNKSILSSPLERLKLLRDVTFYASLSIERRYPYESLARKKQLIHQTTQEMLRERMKGPITLDVLVDSSVRMTDTDARMHASEAPTQQVQNTSPLRQKAFGRTGGLIS